MKLISLKLLHFRRFRQEEIYFKDDFSLIFGKNGSGKSSILDAIGFALFGPSSKDFVRINTGFLKSDFLHDREPSKVELIFQIGMDEYRIVRVIDPGTKKFASDFIIELKDSMFGPKGFEIIGGGEVTNEIIKLIGISRDTFLRSVFAKQKDLEVLSGPREDRKRLINSILGLDKLENIIIQLKKDQKYKKTKLEILKKSLDEFDKKEIEKQREDLKNTFKLLLSKQKIYLENSKKLDDNLKKAKDIYDKEYKKQKEYNTLFGTLDIQKNNLKNINLNLKNKQKELKEIEVLEFFLEKNKSILKQEKECVIKLEKLNNQKKDYELKTSLEKEILEYEKKIKTITDSKEIFKDHDLGIIKQKELIDKINKEIKDIYGNSIKLKGILEDIKTSGKELKNELEQIQKLGDKADCPTCKRPLINHLPTLVFYYEEALLKKREEYKKQELEFQKITSIINLKEKEYKDFQQTLIFLENQKNESIKKLQELKSLKDSKEIIQKKLQTIQNVKYSESEHQKLNDKYKEIRFKYDDYISKKGQVSKKQDLIKSIKDLEKDILNTKNHISKIELNIKDLGFRDEDFKNSKLEYEKLFSKKEILLKEANELNLKKTKLEYDIKFLEEKLESNKKDQIQVNDLVKTITYDTFKVNILTDYIIYLLDYLKPHIEDLASSYFGIITNYKYSQITLDDDYNILIDSKNIDLFSGGEKDLANLCLRLSLGQNIVSNSSSGVNFLILDEVLGSQDKERQQNILLNLKKLENKFSQILLISHLEDIKELVTNLIEVKIKGEFESEIMEI